MICKNCNCELTAPASFCPNCGAPVTPEAPQTAAPGAAPQGQPAPPQGQYAPPQGQYAPPQGQYAPPQGQYAPPQGQYGNPQGQYGYQQNANQQNANQGYFSDFSIGTAPSVPGPNNGSVDFPTAVKLFFKNYTNFKGRASKSEFWWCYLLTLICGFIPFVGWIAALFCFIPGIAVLIRRLHDTGKSGGYYFMCLIPLVGFILVLIQLVKDSDGDNQYGPANPAQNTYPQY